jgi:hypothetical protein
MMLQYKMRILDYILNHLIGLNLTVKHGILKTLKSKNQVFDIVSVSFNPNKMLRSSMSLLGIIIERMTQLKYPNLSQARPNLSTTLRNTLPKEK